MCVSFWVPHALAYITRMQKEFLCTEAVHNDTISRLYVEDLLRLWSDVLVKEQSHYILCLCLILALNGTNFICRLQNLAPGLAAMLLINSDFFFFFKYSGSAFSSICGVQPVIRATCGLCPKDSVLNFPIYTVKYSMLWWTRGVRCISALELARWSPKEQTWMLLLQC